MPGVEVKPRLEMMRFAARFRRDVPLAETANPYATADVRPKYPKPHAPANPPLKFTSEDEQRVVELWASCCWLLARDSCPLGI